MNAEASTGNTDNKLAKREPQQALNLSNGIFFDPTAFETALRVAKGLAVSDMVPATFKGKPGNILIALDFAARAKISPLAVMRGMYLVHGNPAFEGQFVIGLAKQQRAIRDLDYKIKKNSKGEVVSCIATAVLAGTGKEVSTEITWDLVQAEGWSQDKKKRDGGTIISKWKTMREHMFKLRAGAWLVREYCPEVAMGLPTPEEVEDSAPQWDADGVVVTDEITDEELGVDPPPEIPAEDLEGEVTDPPEAETLESNTPEDNGTPAATEAEAATEESADDIFGGKF